MRTLIIDNYDSFTYNLAQLVAQVSQVEPLVVCNDAASWDEVSQADFSQIILSPGPGRPERARDFGICRDAIRDGRWPILGVCLGHQGIAHALGGRVVHAPEPMHGRLSAIRHDGKDLFEGMPQAFQAVRYHSLVAEALPETLIATAWTEDGLIMGLRHRTAPFWGVQFHPESIGTGHGNLLIENFLRLSRSRVANFGDASPAKAETPPKREHGPLTVFRRVLPSPCSSEAAFVQLHGNSTTAVWLDSSLVTPQRSRFSFMADAGGPHAQVVRYDQAERKLTVVDRSGSRVTRGESIFDYLDRRLAAWRVDAVDDLPFDFCGGFIGYLGYEMKAETGGQAAHRSRCADAQFLLADRFVAFDHSTKQTWLVCLDEAAMSNRASAWMDGVQAKLAALKGAATPADRDAGSASSDFRPRHSDERYLESIGEALREIGDGETYEVCLTNELRGSPVSDGLGTYCFLRRMNPAPYSAYLRLEGVEVLCSSPERFVRIAADGAVESKPIKGTVRRGADPEEDGILREGLRNSEKDRSENLMIVDLIRNDLGRVCKTGSVRVPKLFDVESYATVHQLVSTVVGNLRDDRSAVDCVRALFPGGSMTGAPKIRTMEILDRLERGPRGIYSGALGYLSFNGTVDLNIVIRTIVLDETSSSIGIGGAIVALSDPQAELEEIKLKAAVLLRAFEAAKAASAREIAPDSVARVAK